MLQFSLTGNAIEMNIWIDVQMITFTYVEKVKWIDLKWYVLVHTNKQNIRCYTCLNFICIRTAERFKIAPKSTTIILIQVYLLTFVKVATIVNAQVTQHSHMVVIQYGKAWTSYHVCVGLLAHIWTYMCNVS